MFEPISNKETLARLIFSPRYCDDTLTGFNNRFISLRNNEEGISCCRFTLMTETEINKRGKLLARKDIYKGYALAVVEDIISIDSKVIVVVATSNDHAEIRFVINGENVRGNVRYSELQFYFDEIRDLFLKQIVKY